MNNLRAKLLTAFGVLAAAMFVYGIIQLFIFRTHVGDTLPPYSSYRADPVGVKGFYEGLAELPGMVVRRNRDKLDKLAAKPGETIVFAGTAYYGDIDEVEEEIVEALEAAANAGARVVFAFVPDPEGGATTTRRDKKAAADGTPDDKKEASDDKEKEGREDSDDIVHPPATVSLRERWGVTCRFAPLPLDATGNYEPAAAAPTEAYGGLPTPVSWHAALYFTDLADSWHTVYRRDERPVLIERVFGAGAIVLSADSYFMSNEALRLEPKPGLLSWIVGPSHTVVFDEYLHGIRMEPGIMALARRYRLHGLGLGLLALGILYLWRSMSPLVPHRSEPTLEDAVALEGRDAAAALLTLLRRHVPRHELLATCIREWRSAQPGLTAEKTHKIEEAEALAAAEESKPIKTRNRAEAYRAIAALLDKPSRL